MPFAHPSGRPLRYVGRTASRLSNLTVGGALSAPSRGRTSIVRRACAVGRAGTRTVGVWRVGACGASVQLTRFFGVRSRRAVHPVRPVWVHSRRARISRTGSNSRGRDDWPLPASGCRVSCSRDRGGTAAWGAAIIAYVGLSRLGAVVGPHRHDAAHTAHRIQPGTSGVRTAPRPRIHGDVGQRFRDVFDAHTAAATPAVDGDRDGRNIGVHGALSRAAWGRSARSARSAQPIQAFKGELLSLSSLYLALTAAVLAVDPLSQGVTRPLSFTPRTNLSVALTPRAVTARTAGFEDSRGSVAVRPSPVLAIGIVRLERHARPLLGVISAWRGLCSRR